MSKPSFMPDLRVRTGLESLVSSVRSDLALVAPLRGAGEASRQATALIADLEHQLERSEEVAVVTLVGPTGAGKSTLLNALAGRQIAVEGVSRPTTSKPTAYVPSDLDPAVLERFRDVDLVRYDPDPTHSSSGHVLIDAPDVNSVATSHRRTVEDLAAASDVLLVVLHRQAIVEESTLSFVDRYIERRRVAVVLNREDELAPAARDALLAQIHEKLAPRWRVPNDAVFCLSAKLARDDGGRAPGFQALAAWIDRLVDERVIEGVRRSNVAGTLRALALLYRELRDRIGPVLEDFDRLGEEAWTEVGDKVGADVARRLDARRADLELYLGAELVKRWRGPGGWILRMGLWGPMASMGAMALRRNPLVGGAVALGGVAVDKLRSARAESRVMAGASIVPTSTELADFCRDAHRPVRMAASEVFALENDDGVANTGERFSKDGADRETVSALVELGDPSELAAELIGVRLDDRWSTVVERDLPEHVDRSALARVGFLLDLPVYGLALHVGWRTVTAYFSGAYLGVDYYVNSAVLGMLGAGAIYLLSRWSVAWSAHRFGKKAAQAMHDAALEAAASAAAGAGPAHSPARRALERLADAERTLTTVLPAP